MSGNSDPTNIAASAITENSALITWTPSTGTGYYQAYGYRLRVYTASIITPVIQQDIPGVSTSSYNLTNLSPNTTYFLYVQGCMVSMGTCAVGAAQEFTFKTLAPPPLPPINCQGTWSDCDCTTGKDTYHITTQANATGTACPYREGETKPCDIPCGTPAQSDDCVGRFGRCSQDCGGGKQTYTYVSGDCGGLSTGDTQDCNTTPCAAGTAVVDCVGDWGTCKNSIQTYSITTSMSNGGKTCDYNDGDTQACDDSTYTDEPSTPWGIIMIILLILVLLGIGVVWIKVP